MERIISPDGTPIACRKTGTGPPLLLVHGTTADHSRWDRTAPRFAEKFTVYAMDRRGRGGSGDAPEYSLEREAEDVAAVVDAIGEPTSVLGHSYGALASLEAAILTKGMRRLVLYEPPIPTEVEPYPPGTPARMQTLLKEGRLEDASLLFFREVVKMPEHELDAYRRLPVWQVRVRLAPTVPREMEGEASYRFRAEKFAELPVPTLLLLGGDSPPLFRQALEAVDSALPNSRVRVMPGQQHVAMDTAPGLFLEETLGFLLEPVSGQTTE